MRGVPSPPPPQIQAAIGQLEKALHAAEGRPVDALAAPWGEVETGVIKLLGGGFSPDDPAHQSVAFMVAAAFAQRLCARLGAFWFPNRATPQGAGLGFPAGIILFSPFAAAAQALMEGRLPMLDEVEGELEKVLAQARAQGRGRPGAPDRALGPADYQRLFDPGLAQFVCVQPAGAQAAWNRTPPAEARELEQAFARVTDVPADQRKPLQRQLVEALRRLDPARSIHEQLPDAPQLGEMLALLHGSAAQTGLASAELWEQVLLPLLHIGAAQSFPEIDDEVLEGFRNGVPPVLLYVDTIPYQTPAADEDGMLGVFPPDEIQVLDPAFAASDNVRLACVDPGTLAPLTARFDGAALRASVERWTAELESAAGAAPPEARSGEPSLLDIAVLVLDELSKVVTAAQENNAVLCVRHATESEATAEPLLQHLRHALTAPRIILP
jgi:hypothetical protein